MKRFYIRIVGSAILALGVPFITAQIIPATTQSNIPKADIVHLNALITQLGDPDFSRREAAQMELEKSPPNSLDFLRAAAQKSADAEINTRLAKAIAEIHDNAILNPPPISISIDGKGLDPVVTAFNNAIQVPESYFLPGRSDSPLNYTLHANETPFWNAFFAVAAQHPLKIQEEGGRMRISYDVYGWRAATVVGPLAIVPGIIARTRMIRLQADPDHQIEPEDFRFTCDAALDPRIPVVRFGPVRFLEITDDHGNNLAPPPREDILRDAERGRPPCVYSASENLKVPPNIGTRIVSAKGSIHFVVEVGEELVEIDDIDKRNGQTFDIGTVKLRLIRKESSVVMQQVHDPDHPSKETNPAITLTLKDGTARELVRKNEPAGANPSLEVPPGGATPYKLILSRPNRIKDLIIPFELKDLPLP